MMKYQIAMNKQHAEVIQALVQKAHDPLEGMGCSNCTVLQNTVWKLKNSINSVFEEQSKEVETVKSTMKMIILLVKYS